MMAQSFHIRFTYNADFLYNINSYSSTQASPQSTTAPPVVHNGGPHYRGQSQHANTLQRSRASSSADRGKVVPIRPRSGYGPLPTVVSAPSSLYPSAISGPGRHCMSEPPPRVLQHNSSPPRSADDRALVVTAQRPRHAPCAAQREAANAARRQSQQLDSIGYGEMRAAHAAGRQARFPIATTPSGEILGQRTKWHRAVQAIARRTLDWSIREHKKHPLSWKWSLATIQRELDEMFTFDVPVREDVLTEYVAGFISNDRSKWKKFWTEHNHQKHEDCPDEAFAMLHRYWRSDVGKRESEIMKEKRSRVGATFSGSLPYSDDSPSQKRTRHGQGEEDFLDFPVDATADPMSRLGSPVSAYAKPLVT